MDTNLSSYLFNPFTLNRIELPSLKSCPRKGGKNLVIARAILSSNPSPKRNNFAVIAILGFSKDSLQQLGFLNFGDSEWSWPGETGETGNDFRGHMFFHINRLYIICDDKNVVEIWEISQSQELIRKVQIKLESSDGFFYKHSYISHMFEFHGQVFVIRRHWREYDKIDIYLLDQETLTWNIPSESLLEEMVLFIDVVRVIAVSETRVAESCKEGAIVYDARNKYVCRGSMDPVSEDTILEWPKNNLKKVLDSPLWIVPNLMS
ncbi:hypothetical protein LIER_33459 [Lithospermum erythrorhizon]|uniref:KIB1-4 beta-propeller domain-containing protein n=1 Tax=Lithospermum erythrorhizon TaxID=34254 RepID=A0AAV3RWR1_LITER